MGYVHDNSVRKAKTISVLVASASVGLMGIAHAQTAGPAPANASPKPAAAVQKPKASDSAGASEKKNPDVALKAYGAGTRAFEAGKMGEAVDQLSKALSAGGLPSNQMAKALYYRGAAYRKQGKPAMAISDLTSSLWLKGGLSDSDRALATDARQAAYREAGLGDSAPAISAQQTAAVAPAASAVAVAPAAAPTAPAAAAAPAAASAPAAGGATLPWGQATGAATEPIATLGSVPEAPRVAATSAPLDNSLSSAVAMTSTASAAAPNPAPASPTAPVMSAVEAAGGATVPTANPLAGAGQSVTGFFNNMGSSIGKMFSSSSGSADSGSQATQTASSPVMTSSTGPVYANTPEAGATQPGWEDKMVVKPSQTTVATAQPAKQQAKAGAILLQVAAVRSREEADQVSTRLKGTPAVKNSAAGTSIDEAVIGNMGTFYRVRLGPFADATEPNKLCAVLKPEGYDCLVVSQ